VAENQTCEVSVNTNNN